jgi:TolA-binding protein
MSGDPERLLSGAHVDPLERELLGSVRHVGPPEGAKDQAWRGIATQIAVVAVVGAATGSSAAAATKTSAGALASWAMSTKVAAVVAASGLALGGGYLAATAKEPAPAQPSAAHVASALVVTPGPAKAAAEQPAEAAPPPALEDAPSRKLEPRRQDLLKAESSLLTEARAQLRSGNVAGAQTSLERLQTQFPKGMLTQEREVLAIEVLYARGNVDGAKRRARAFVKAYPKSPHSVKLSRFID